MIRKIFLDLDGVVRDWDGGVIKWYNLDLKHEQINNWGYITDYVFEHHQMSEKDFWEGQTEEFWKNLQMTKDAAKILELLDSTTAKVFILTSPTLNNAGGTQQWIRKHMPRFFNEKRYFIGPSKYACACSDSILIDDCDKNVDAWDDWGGKSFLYPQPWNRMYRYTNYAVEELEHYLKGMGVI